MWLSNPARHYNCSNESSLFLEQDLINFNSENYLLVQEIQLLLNGLSVLGFIALFACRGLYPKNVSTNAKILLTFFLLTFLGHSFIAMIYKLHYFLMSEIATCISAWVLPFYANAHLLYVVCSNSPFWFLLALIFERLAALMGWRNYETSGPVLAIFLVLIAISGVAVHTIFPYFGSGIIGISIDLTYAHKVRQVNKVKNFFVTVTLFHGTIACLILYCISKRKLMQCKAKLMSPYQLVENVQINCLLLKILTLYLLINLAGDFYLDYVDLPVYRSFLRKNNFDYMVFHRVLLPIQLVIIYGALNITSDRHNFA